LETGRPKKADEVENLRLELSPSGKDRQISLGVVAIDNVLNRGELNTLEVTVPAAKVALEDNAESDKETAFVASEHWSRVNLPDRGFVFTESPEGDYPPDREAVLVSKPFTLKGFHKPVLHFDAKVDVEKKHDEFTVEIEKDGWFGKSWKEVARFDGISDWENHKLDLGDYADYKETRIRFRLESDRDRSGDGVYLDNIVIADASV
jgi:hypothetical protein